MSRTLAICLGCLLAAASLVAQSAVYRCTANGKVTFSDIPCSSDAKPMEMGIYTPSAEMAATANERTQAIEQNLATGKKQRQLEALRHEIETKKQKMNNALTMLRSQKAQTANRQYGDVEESTLPAEMQSVKLRYQGEIDALNAQIAAIQAEGKNPQK